ncbi:hypothetical protein BU16DRAFT_617415 [Lophium mytilinum]|uniref:Uncharacterized protein n=1 Tax=Lophium mytilinum TaxID=390894 RepID=A0A6A6QUR3_9PEZI|nr:hypothetical protein BU16DRAFT_617415 [Lophium mytilinum]
MASFGAGGSMANAPHDANLEEVPRKDTHICGTPHEQRYNTTQPPSKRKPRTSTPLPSISPSTGLGAVATEAGRKAAPSNKRPCFGGTYTESDINDRAIVDGEAMQSVDPDTISTAPPGVREITQYKATADSSSNVNTSAHVDMADQQRLVELTTLVRDMAFSFLEHEASEDRKADAMRFRQLLGEIGMLEPKVHDIVVAGHETTFFSFPREIRDEIYKLSLVAVSDSEQPVIEFDRIGPERLAMLKAQEGGLVPFDGSELLEGEGIVMNLLRTSRQVKLEAEETFYKYNNFSFPNRQFGEFYDGCTLGMFHLSLSSSAFANIRSLQIHLGSPDDPRWYAEAPEDPEDLKSAELNYLKKIDPHYLTKYSHICRSPDGTVLDNNLWLFTTWVNKLDHVFKMPALKHLDIDMYCVCGWIGKPHEAPKPDPLRAATQIILSRMRDRKKSGLGCIRVGVSRVDLSEMPGLWTERRRIDMPLEATTENCDLNYSADENWGHSDLTESEGLSGSGTAIPVNDVSCGTGGDGG